MLWLPSTSEISVSPVRTPLPLLSRKPRLTSYSMYKFWSIEPEAVTSFTNSSNSLLSTVVSSIISWLFMGDPPCLYILHEIFLYENVLPHKLYIIKVIRQLICVVWHHAVSFVLCDKVGILSSNSPLYLNNIILFCISLYFLLFLLNFLRSYFERSGTLCHCVHEEVAKRIPNVRFTV